MVAVFLRGDVWIYVVEEEERVAPFRRGGIDDGEMADVLGKPRGVGHGQEAAPGVAEEVNFVEAEMRAQGIEVIDLIGERAGLALLQGPGAARAALVPHDDFAALPESVPGVGNVEIHVVEARAAIGNEERRAGAGAEYLVIDGGARGVEGCAMLFMSGGDWRE